MKIVNTIVIVKIFHISTFVNALNVFVVQKTKRTAGIIEKINQKKAQVRMRGSIYNVPFSMIEAA